MKFKHLGRKPLSEWWDFIITHSVPSVLNPCNSHHLMDVQKITHHKQHPIESEIPSCKQSFIDPSLYTSKSNSWKIQEKNLRGGRKFTTILYIPGPNFLTLTSLPCALYVPPLAYSSWYKCPGLNRKKVPQGLGNRAKSHGKQISFSPGGIFFFLGWEVFWSGELISFFGGGRFFFFRGLPHLFMI